MTTEIPRRAETLIPPPETIWHRYSPNGESIFSGLTSFLIHASVLALVLVGIGMLFHQSDRAAVEEIEPVELGGGDRRPEGASPARDTVIRMGQDKVEFLDRNRPEPGIVPPPAGEPRVRPAADSNIPDDPLARAFQEKISK